MIVDVFIPRSSSVETSVSETGDVCNCRQRAIKDRVLTETGGNEVISTLTYGR